jgi:peptidoglycan L-alanyl-D-glutamate endopeptidase CwlK
MHGSSTPLLMMIAFYFVGVVIIGLLLLFSAPRTAILRAFQKIGQGIRSLFTKKESTPVDFGKASKLDQAKGNAVDALSGFWANRYLILGTVIVLLIPIIFTLFMHKGYEKKNNRAEEADQLKIKMLLANENFLPPESLPSSVFLTPELTVLRPDLATADRNYSLLDADLRQRLLLTYRLMREAGYEMVLIEGYRSAEHQYMLERNSKKTVIDNRALQAPHRTGLAADSAFYKDGRIVISDKTPWVKEGYQKFGETAEKAGLLWGGRWKQPDYGHVELRRERAQP